METSINTSEDNNFVTFVDRSLFPKLNSDYFDANYWASKQAITGSAKGRGTTWFFLLDQKEFVLRHYHRGGMIGRVLNDEYLYLGKKATRAYQEFHLLCTMRALGLPVPQAAAARIERFGLFYRADIITTRIQHSESFVERLKKASAPQELWRNIGKTIRQFHDHNVYHHDLNANNILIDDQDKVWLIDFDRGYIAKNTQSNSSWKQDNVKRLLRSLEKEKNKHDDLKWHEDDWDTLIHGYNSKI